jgi:ribosomal protein L11 methylase PrmA
MLDLAGVGPGDVVYDLGCGDGRIVIAAARRGARGVGIDLDPARIREATASAARAGVTERVEFRVGDLFQADVRPATAVMLFLWPEVNLRLRPKLRRELAPGTRVVSHWHDMGDWAPERTVKVGRVPVYLWTIR